MRGVGVGRPDRGRERSGGHGGILARRAGGRLALAPQDRAVLATAWCTLWVAQPVAMATNVNPVTPILAVLAAWQLRAARKPTPDG